MVVRSLVASLSKNLFIEMAIIELVLLSFSTTTLV